MKESEILYAAAESMRKGGFSIDYNPAPACGCFMFHLPDAGNPSSDEFVDAMHRIHAIVGDFSARGLSRSGWTAEHKDDAIAALTIAADCAFEEEKQQ